MGVRRRGITGVEMIGIILYVYEVIIMKPTIIYNIH